MTKAMFQQPWVWSFIGAFAALVASVLATGGAGAMGIISTGSALASFLVIAGLAQVLVIALGPGNIDLSIAANIGLASVVAMKVMNGDDALIVTGLIAAISCGLVIGVGNYLLIRVLRVPPIIATLSAGFIIQSLNITYGRGLQIKPPPAFAAFTSVQLWNVPLLFVVALALTGVLLLVLRRTLYGRAVLAVGQSARAATLAGLPVELTRCVTYAACGMLAALNGALLAGYFRGSNTDIGNEYLLGSIAVVVVGGTAVTGGEANLRGIWGASLFIVLLLTLLNTYGASAGLRLLLTGVIIIAVIAAAGGRRDGLRS
jgi:ribose transport system permease protein